MSRDQRKVAVLILACLAAGILPLLSAVQLLKTAGGLLLGYATYRIGTFLWDLAQVYAGFKLFEDRTDRIARQWRRKPFVRLVRR